MILEAKIGSLEYGLVTAVRTAALCRDRHRNSLGYLCLVLPNTATNYRPELDH